MAKVALSELPSRASDPNGNPQARTDQQLVQKAYEDTYTAQIKAAQALVETEKSADSADAGTYIKQVDGLLMSGLVGMSTAAKRDWSADQLTGQPDATAGADDRRAWASATADGQGEWIELSYEKPVEAVAVVIFETHNPARISSVKAFAADDRWIWVLDQRSARPSERRSQATTLPIQWGEPVNRIRISLESVAVPGWNEIDAVGLLDNRGQVHWAASAKASSVWGQQSAGNEEYQKVVKLGLNWIKEHQQSCTRAPRQTNCATCHDTAAHSKLDMKDWKAYTHDGAERAALVKWIAEPATHAPAAEVEAADRQRRLEQLRAEIAETDRQLATIQEEFELERARVDQRQQLDNLRISLDQMRQFPKNRPRFQVRYRCHYRWRRRRCRNSKNSVLNWIGSGARSPSVTRLKSSSRN